ncbi:hypothetical protein F2Q69_00022742 [Brassica cretica]|uniref:Uncharacterized protein n=1 Tax=Brassica cretica TaxID=69181 RepID=A0A8S9QBK3_BRACR|nr:hypothetical protein F2Q69_00022742 [Brassica cretica]
MRKKSKKNGNTYQRYNGQLIETNELDRPRDSARTFAELDQSSSENGRAGSTTGFISGVRQTGPVQFGEWPSWIEPGIQLGHLPSWTSPVWQTIELDRQRDSARTFAELDQSSSENGRAGSSPGFSSAICQAGPVQFGERPSWIDHGIQLGRSPSWTSPVRRTTELDRPQNSDRPFAELD